MNIDAFFYENPVFRLNHYIAWKQDTGTKHLTAIHASLQYYLKTGRLINIRRGLYAVVAPNATPENMSVDPYLIAAMATDDAVLGYHTALELHGAAYSTFGKFIFKTLQKAKAFYFQNQLFQPTSLSKILLNKKEMMGVTILDRQGIKIRVTDIEHTFVDALHRIELCGGLEEVIRSLRSIAALNAQHVIEYTMQLKNKVLAAKVGFCLSQRPGVFAVEEMLLDLLLNLKPESPQYFDTHEKKSCQYDKKWNLMIPEKIIKIWEGLDHDV